MNLVVVGIEEAANILGASEITKVTEASGMRATHFKSKDGSGVLVQGSGEQFFLMKE